MNTLPTTSEPARPNPASPDETAAYLLTQVLADPALTLGKALEAQRARVAALRDPTSPQALDELTRQLPLLEALFQRFSYEALKEKRSDRAAGLLRVALSAQQAHARTFALVRGLAQQGKGLGAVLLDSESPRDDRSSAADGNRE